MSRYNRRAQAINDEEQYRVDEIFENRGVEEITQFVTPQFKRLTREQYNAIDYTRYYWKAGDRYWKLADKFYGDVSLWWIIASFNYAPTESHLEEGQEIRIPTNPSVAGGYFK